jgi:hypothetical protein
MAETVAGKEGVTGVRILVAVQREGSSIFLELEVENKTNSGLATQAVRLDANSYKLQPVSINLSGPVTAPGGAFRTRVELDFGGKSSGQPPSMPFRIKAMIATNQDMFAFQIPVSFSVLLTASSKVTEAYFNDLMNRPNQVSAKESFPSKIDEQEVWAR